MSEKENELSEDYETEENIEQGEDSAEDMTEDKELSEGEGETESSEVDEDESEPDEDDEVISGPQFIYEMAGTIIVAIAVLFIVMTFFVRQVTVDGPSMNNTLQDADRLLVSCFNYTPQNGDIVIVTHGEELDKKIVKRVIATEGQRLKIDYSTGEVTVDGVLLKEDYIIGTTVKELNSTEIPEVIPKGYVFVMGDNRENSLDSRSKRVGLVPVENIIGKAFFRISPFDTFGFLS